MQLESKKKPLVLKEKNSDLSGEKPLILLKKAIFSNKKRNVQHQRSVHLVFLYLNHLHIKIYKTGRHAL